MRRFCTLFILLFTVLAVTTACSKKKKNTAPGSEAPPPPHSEPAPVPPSVNPNHPTDVDHGTWGYCGSSNDIFVGPTDGYTYYDSTYALYWFQIEDYATFFAQGQWQWFSPSCSALHSWARQDYGYNYLYQYQTPSSQPCYDCSLYFP